MAAYYRQRIGLYEKVQGVADVGDLITTVRRDVSGRYIDIQNNSDKSVNLAISDNLVDPTTRKTFFLKPAGSIPLLVNSAGTRAQWLFIEIKNEEGKRIWKNLGVLRLDANLYIVNEGVDGWWLMPHYSSSRLH
jgi:hypothetical protein